MKKLITLALALVMTASISVPAFAATVDQNDTNPKDENVTVTTSIDPTYIVTIPGDTTVAYDDNNATSTDFGTITADNVRLNPLKKIVVSVDADLTMKNADDNTKTIPYTITSGGNTFNSVDLFTTGDSAVLKIDITSEAWSAAYAGNYSDVVKFTVAYVDKNSD